MVSVEVWHLKLHLYSFNYKRGVYRVPERVQKMFCTMFKRTEEEQKNYDARVELSKTKEELKNTSDTLNKAMELIAKLSDELSSIKEELNNTKESK